MVTLLADVGVGINEAPAYTIGWGTLSLINAGLAQSKNRSGLWWWVISLFLGPIATFIIVALLHKEEVPQTTRPEEIESQARALIAAGNRLRAWTLFKDGLGLTDAEAEARVLAMEREAGVRSS